MIWGFIGGIVGYFVVAAYLKVKRNRDLYRDD